MYYKICPHCGVHLDPGERCDCQGIREPVIIVAGQAAPSRQKKIRSVYYANKSDLDSRCGRR